MGRKFFTFLWLSSFVCSVHAATTSTIDQDFIKQTLGKILIDKPLKDFKSNAPDVAKTISIGFHSSQEIEYFPRVRKYKVADQLMGYVAYLFANRDIRILQELFYEPKRKEWNELGDKLAVNPLSSLGIMCFWTLGKKTLLRHLDSKIFRPAALNFISFLSLTKCCFRFMEGCGERQKKTWMRKNF